MKKFQILMISVLILIILILITQIFFMQVLSKASIKLKDRTLDVEIADDFSERTKGLQFHEPLKENEGMLFIFQQEGYHRFWMPNMKFPLDILWIDKNFKIIHIERDVPPCESIPCPSYEPSTPAMYVLEVKSNSTNDIRIGDSVDISNAI